MRDEPQDRLRRSKAAVVAMGLCVSAENGDYVGINHYDGKKLLGFRHGVGTYFYENGDMYKGEWKWNEKHGHGVYTHKNGEEKQGFFYHDEYIGNNPEDLFAATKCSCFGSDAAALPLLNDRQEKSCEDREKMEARRRKLEENAKKIEEGKRLRDEMRRKYTISEKPTKSH